MGESNRILAEFESREEFLLRDFANSRRFPGKGLNAVLKEAGITVLRKMGC
jgi:hypothetical protein